MADERRAGTTDVPGPDLRPDARARLASAGRRLAARIPPPWGFVLAVFVGSKVVLSLVGVLVLTAWDGVPGAPPADEAMMRTQQDQVSSHRWVSLWFAWDSFLYDHLARLPLDQPWRDFGFPLLYPFLARPLAPLLGGHTAWALLVVANVALLFQLYLAYRLGGRLLGADDPGEAGADGRRAVRYLLLLPTAFLFQAALTESLFICLALAAFWYAEQRRWLLVGIVGYFLAMSRSVGFVVVIPLALVLLRQHGWRLDPRSLGRYLRQGWPLLLVPAGWLTFMAFCRWQGGDWFAYQHAQEKGWGIKVQNPLGVAGSALVGDNSANAFRVWIAVAMLLVAVVGLRRRADWPYLAYTVIVVLVPLSMGPPVYKSLLRYLLAAFPVAFVLARWARRPGLDGWLTAGLALLQGALFAVWLTYWTHLII
ncbi:hypothetical protein ACFFMM_25085 [Micromonospora chaiyaphumensis]|uniref:Mannosyltransferase (PIG-V) n=1 Tax=Micromonospora chaiyaphumensis TaxID=307119 RepID=A0A1C4UKU1_9ACTN|nr:hypothetical protein [Micromonospora chaiyaphumensis]SCE72257.1 hypothetical protein GA0070214_101788 [Micromonospora chaiyaphumensis]